MRSTHPFIPLTLTANYINVSRYADFFLPLTLYLLLVRSLILLSAKRKITILTVCLVANMTFTPKYRNMSQSQTAIK